MKTQDVSCAAQRNLQEIAAKRNRQTPTTTPNSPLYSGQHQNIAGTRLCGQAVICQGGVIVPTPYQTATSSPLNIPKILTPDSTRRSSMQKTSPSTLSNPTVSFSAATSSATPMSESSTNKPEEQKMRMSQSGVLYTLHMIREPVVEYQETRGIPRNEEITFVTLVTSLCTQAYTAAITILVMLWNLMPLVDGFVYFVRFLLDKIIDILQTQDNKDKAIKGAIFFGELTVVIFLIFMIVGLIFMPVYVLMARLFSKVFSMIAW